MTAPLNVPLGCPRRTDNSSGPRRCGEECCPLHLRTIQVGRGRRPESWRTELQRELDDSCSLDVAERSKASGVDLTLHELGLLTGCTKQAAEQVLKSAIRKVKIALRVRSA